MNFLTRSSVRIFKCFNSSIPTITPSRQSIFEPQVSANIWLPSFATSGFVLHLQCNWLLCSSTCVSYSITCCSVLTSLPTTAASQEAPCAKSRKMQLLCSDNLYLDIKHCLVGRNPGAAAMDVQPIPCHDWQIFSLAGLHWSADLRLSRKIRGVRAAGRINVCGCMASQPQWCSQPSRIGGRLSYYRPSFPPSMTSFLHSNVCLKHRLVC